MRHITVLQNEAVLELALNASSLVVDATLGSGGHSRAILEKLGKTGTYIGMDADQSAIDSAKDWIEKYKAESHLVHANFKNIDAVIKDLNLQCVDAILADLGWRIEQFEDSGKGFSFNSDDPLLMTFGNPADYAFTAGDIVNEWDEQDIANVIYGYGGERFSRRIAKAIVEYRKKQKIETAKELSEIVRNSTPSFYRKGKVNPATKTFQGLRIAVNDELSVLEEFIEKAFEALCPKGRLAIISFHSLEDKIVKECFKSYARDQVGLLVNKKPIIPTEEELRANPRSRSAKLRIIEKL
ncbi:16S rRNA (cytosine(1402)-N(4))-methyltransferase RsmH [Candidatus Kaiserbacteria bacterium]|nr:16S rRNA (cytosine(1402)-N(4))-methyltransferase RsmH [Candidatus Kaiserbacteria bacterium]